MKKVSLVILSSVMAFSVVTPIFTANQAQAAEKVATVKTAGQYTFKLTATDGMDKFLAPTATAKVTGKKAKLNINLTDPKLISMIKAFKVAGATAYTNTSTGFSVDIPANNLNTTLSTTTSVASQGYSHDYPSNVTLEITKFVADKKIVSKKEANKSTKKTTKKTAKKVAKKSTKKTAKKVAKKSTKKTAKKVAKKSTKKTVKKQATKKVSKVAK